MYSSLYYNLHVAGSVTATGRSLISNATMFFEGFLSNNVKFGSLNQVITFITNVCKEKKDRKFNDKVFIDKFITTNIMFLVMTLSYKIPFIKSSKVITKTYQFLLISNKK